MRLRLIDLAEDDLRAALAQYAEEMGDPEFFESYRFDDYDQDTQYVWAIRALDEWLQAERHINPFDNVDITLVADVDGAIEGYEFSYNLWSPPSISPMPMLWLGSSFYRWKDIRGEQNGIEGVVDFLGYVISALNQSIKGFNAWADA